VGLLAWMDRTSARIEAWKERERWRAVHRYEIANAVRDETLKQIEQIGHLVAFDHKATFRISVLEIERRLLERERIRHEQQR
jgi:hypothetical protein